MNYVYPGPRNAGGRVLEYSVGNGIGLNLCVSFYNLHTRLLETSPTFFHSIFYYISPVGYVSIRGLLLWSRYDVNVDLLAFPTFALNETSNSVLEYPSKVLAAVLALVTL